MPAGKAQSTNIFGIEITQTRKIIGGEQGGLASRQGFGEFLQTNLDA